MDSRDSLHPPQHHHHHLHPLHHHHTHQPPHSQTPITPPSQHPNHSSSSSYTNNHSINPNSITATYLHHHHQQQHQNPHFPLSSDTLYSGGDGSSPPSAAGFRSSSGGGGFNNEPKKKRGRPRKYSPSPDGNNIALGLAPSPITTPKPVSSVGGGGGHAADSNDGGHSTPVLSDTSGKKARGRPAGSGKKQLDALGSPGIGFTPHVITVKTGEDIASKIMAFSQQGPRTVCILSANGAICNVTLRQPAMSGGTVTYEGRFEIISLSGSFLLSESNGNRSRTGGLSVSLAGPDGRVLGGGVAGTLMAATPVQVIVGSFIADGKKTKSGSSSTPPGNMLNFGAPVPGASPPSEGASSESSDESGGSSPNNNNRISAPSSYNNNASTQQQSIQNIPMYATNMGWANSTINMLPN